MKDSRTLSDEFIARRVNTIDTLLEDNEASKEDLIKELSFHRNYLKNIQKNKKERDEFIAEGDQFGTLKEFALRGFATLASGHELCGILDSIRYHTKQISDETIRENRLKELDRVNTIFSMFISMNGYTSQKINHNELINCLSKYEDSQTKIILDDSCKNLEYFANVYVFRAIIYNIVNNASYFARQNSEYPKIVIKFHENALYISDNGAGIDPDDEHKLFSYGYSNRRHGHGFGLALCREFGASQKIQIIYEPNSEFNELGGACFKILLS